MARPAIQLAAHDAGYRWRGGLSTLLLLLALLTIAGGLLASSPPADATYPGAVPWSDKSLLKPLVDALSLGGWWRSTRGVEIKDAIFHFAVTPALLLLACRALVSARHPVQRPRFRGGWFWAQLFLAGWVALSLFSALWSGDPRLSLGQGVLYAFALAWAVALAWGLEGRDVPRLVMGYVILAAAAATLCIWYYHERNPAHRPGFPVGNPGVLAACLVPAICVCAANILGAALSRRIGARSDWRLVIVSLAALVPLVWAFNLTDARAAKLGLLGGVIGVALVLATPRIRWVVFLGGGATVLATIFYFFNTRVDLAMARGASLRFRFYAWQYAAELWNAAPLIGHGAGMYPVRVAGLPARATHEALDPQAFMGDVIAHAHNELFEVFVEIGLVGSVTFVGGAVATIVAAAAVVRANLSARRRWLLIGLTAGVLAMLIDSLGSASMRLPATPVVFFSLLGVLWAASRAYAGAMFAAGQKSVRAAGRPVTRYLFAAACLLAAVPAAWAAAREFAGFQAAYASRQAANADRPRDAARHAREAAKRLLDPARVLVQDVIVAQQWLDAADADYRRWIAARESEDHAAARQLRRNARDAAERAVDAAVETDQRARGFGRMAGVQARAYEILGATATDPALTKRFTEEAGDLWEAQAIRAPYDEQAMIALTRYPPLSRRLGALRKSYRALFLRDGDLTAHDYLDPVLAELADSPALIAQLERWSAVADTIAPQTDVTLLIASFAPETYRLRARWHFLADRPRQAAADARRASSLYESLTSRFPFMRPVALGERAWYLLYAEPDQPDDAIIAMHAAIDALPPIQAQKAAAAARPYRLRLAQMYLAQGNQSAADTLVAEYYKQPDRRTPVLVKLYEDLVQRFIRRAAATRPPVDRWLAEMLRLDPDNVFAWSWRAWLAADTNPGPKQLTAVRETLAEARAAGVGTDRLDRVRNSLCKEFPALADALCP